MLNKEKDKNNKQKRNWLFGAILSFYVLKKFFKIRKSRKLKDLEHNFKDFLKEESNEIKRYTSGKENLEEFAEDSGSLIKDYFIPHSGNNHMPKILHTKSLAIIVLLTFILKFSLVAYLYFVFPNHGKADNLMVPTILELVNNERKLSNLKPLSLNPVLSNSALAKANDMVTNDYFAHTSLDGRKPWDFIDRSLYAYSIVGENLAMNFSTAESAHKALVNSPSHKQNLLNEKYQDIGLAVVNGEIGGKNTNVLVQIFSVKVSLDDTNKPKTLAVASPAKPEIVAKPAPEKVEVLSSQQKESTVSASKVAEVKPVIEKTAEKPAEKPVEKPAPVAAKASEPAEVKASVEEPIKSVVAKSEPVKQILSDTNAEPKENFSETTSTPAVIEETMRVIKHPGDQILAKYAEERLSAIQAEVAQKEKTLPDMNLAIENSADEHFVFSKKFIYMIQIAIASLLSLLIVSLLLNIFIRFEIQHKPVLIRTMIVVIFVAALLFINFHYLESGTTMIYMS